MADEPDEYLRQESKDDAAFRKALRAAAKNRVEVSEHRRALMSINRSAHDEEVLHSELLQVFTTHIPRFIGNRVSCDGCAWHAEPESDPGNENWSPRIEFGIHLINMLIRKLGL